MKKLGLLVLVAGIILMAGCAGDDPSDPGGTLSTVTGLEILATSSGRTVNLSWTAVTDDIDGYEVYFKSNGTGEWDDITTVTGTTYSHTADNAGDYSVRAYKDENFSENYATEKTTMPIFISPLYKIWNNHAPDWEHSGILFEDDGATTGLASGTFDQDLYCYDGGGSCYTWLYSGDYGTFGNGSPTDMWDHSSNYAYPGDGPWVYGAIENVGDVIFAELSDGHYIKIYINALPHYEGGSDNAWGIELYYDYQPIEGLYLFTTDSN